jgi:hypothetical protein
MFAEIEQVAQLSSDSMFAEIEQLVAAAEM